MAAMRTTEQASRAFVPEVGKIDPFNTEVVGREEQGRREAEAAQPAGIVGAAGQFDRPVEFRRMNRYGFVVCTRHMSQASLDYEMVEPDVWEMDKSALELGY